MTPEIGRQYRKGLTEAVLAVSVPKLHALPLTSDSRSYPLVRDRRIFSSDAHNKAVRSRKVRRKMCLEMSPPVAVVDDDVASIVRRLAEFDGHLSIMRSRPR
jgi:hypothetical protein